MDFTTEIAGHTLEFIHDEHLYLVDGIIVPSVTHMLKAKFGNKYNSVRPEVLKAAADKGTQVHDAIEQYCKTGEAADLQEVYNFRFLQKQYGFAVKANEIPVMLFLDGAPIAAGRLDLVLEMDGKIGGGDIKRTASLDKEYLAYQLNLYRIAYKQCYGVEWEFIKGLHLRDSKRKFVDIPINEDMTWAFVKDYVKQSNEQE